MSGSLRIRSGRHDDPVARTHVRRHARRAALWSFAVILPVAGVAWLLVWSPWLKVDDIAVRGVADPSAIRAALAGELGRSILRVDTRALTAAVADAVPSVRDISVAKSYPHGITVTATDRTPAGVWCRGDSCRLWDRSGARWGDAVPSVGTLLILVNDQRTDDSLDPAFLTGLLAAIDGMPATGLRVRSVTLPDAEPGGIRITTTAGYDVDMDALGDVADQLSTLSVFLAGRAGDATFAPKYLDLRTPGRVYYQ